MVEAAGRNVETVPRVGFAGFEPAPRRGKGPPPRLPEVAGTEEAAAYQRTMNERVPAVLELKGVSSDRWYRVSFSPIPQATR